MQILVHWSNNEADLGDFSIFCELIYLIRVSCSTFVVFSHVPESRNIVVKCAFCTGTSTWQYLEVHIVHYDISSLFISVASKKAFAL